MSVALVILALAVMAAVMLWFFDRYVSEDSYVEAYREASQRDIEFYNSHPGCTLEEAHRNRDRINRRYGR